MDMVGWEGEAETSHVISTTLRDKYMPIGSVKMLIMYPFDRKSQQQKVAVV